MWDKIIESLQQRWEACYYLFADARTTRAHQAFLNNDEKYQAEVRPRLAKKGIAEPTREQFLAEYALILSEGGRAAHPSRWGDRPRRSGAGHCHDHCRVVLSRRQQSPFPIWGVGFFFCHRLEIFGMQRNRCVALSGLPSWFSAERSRPGSDGNMLESYPTKPLR